MVLENGEIVVISGGTATNSLVNIFQQLSSRITYILPISDNGGSTSEIVRVIGGPAIGDIRSRITRMITDEGFQKLLSYRLSENNDEAKSEWTAIVEGTHDIWNNIEIQCKEMIRSFLIHVHMELLKKSRNPSTNFKYELASIGNLLLTGIRLFVGSLDSAIELILRITRIHPDIKILPCINTNYTYHISAKLLNNKIITGQSQISHPPDEYLIPNDVSFNQSHEDIPYQHPDLMISQLKFSKNKTLPLESPIERIFYINSYGEEIHPKANSRTILSFNNSNDIIYSIGSLMTSIIPVLILQGVGNAIKNSKSNKILLLNGNLDRETMSYTALDFIKTIYNSILYSFGNEVTNLSYNQIITHLIYLENSEIKVEIKEIETLGIKCIEVKKDDSLNDNIHLYNLDSLQDTFSKIMINDK